MPKENKGTTKRRKKRKDAIARLFIPDCKAALQPQHALYYLR
jgi:hypothetical protein